MTIFLSKYEQDFVSMNEAYIASFPTNAPLPVRTCVGVAALPAGTDIEMTLVSSPTMLCPLRYTITDLFDRLRPKGIKALNTRSLAVVKYLSYIACKVIERRLYEVVLDL